jgi:hypothetical protein
VALLGFVTRPRTRGPSLLRTSRVSSRVGLDEASRWRLRNREESESSFIRIATEHDHEWELLNA